MTVKSYGNFIANKWQDATNGEFIAVRDPSNGQEFARIARGTRDDIDLPCARPVRHSQVTGAA